MDLDAWPYPAKPLVPLAETVHERFSVEIFRGCTRGCRFCQAGMITRPVRERSIETIGDMVENGIRKTGFEEVGLLSLSSADHTEIGEVAKGLADRYEGSNVSLSLPSTRVDAFNITLANEFSRNGRRSGLTFAPEGGCERMRKVINKMVTEEDLIRTVATAYSHGWRQVKLYFMCGLPTETDEDVLAIADLAKQVIAKGREVSGRNDIRCTVSIGGFVPKPHTPFQWAAQLDHETTDERLRKLRETVRADKRYGRAIGFRYHDGKPGIIEGLLSRGDRRVGAVIEQVWRDGGRFDGWSEHFSYDRWVEACERALRRRRPRLVHHPRARVRRGAALGPPRLRPRQGLAVGRLGGRPRGRRRQLRRRGRGLPLDALLRLRRLPGDGHRDPDRPHRPAAAAARRRLSRQVPRLAGHRDVRVARGAVALTTRSISGAGPDPRAGSRRPRSRSRPARRPRPARRVRDTGHQQPLVADRGIGLAVQGVEADRVGDHRSVGRGLPRVEVEQHQHLGVVQAVAVRTGQVGQRGLLTRQERRGVDAVATVEVGHAAEVGVLAHDDHARRRPRRPGPPRPPSGRLAATAQDPSLEVSFDPSAFAITQTSLSPEAGDESSVRAIRTSSGSASRSMLPASVTDGVQMATGEVSP